MVSVGKVHARKESNETAQQLWPVKIRVDLGAGHHHILHPDVMKREHVLEDGTLLRGKLLARAIFDRVLDIVAR